MAFESFAIKGLWVLARYVPTMLLRLFFSADRMANLIYVDVQPRHDGVLVDLGGAASATMYLQVINLGPVPVELDRAEFRLRCGGTPVKFSVLKKQTFPVGHVGLIYLNESVDEGRANQIARSEEGNPVSLDGHIEFNSSIRSFARELPHLDGVRPRIINRQQRVLV